MSQQERRDNGGSQRVAGIRRAEVGGLSVAYEIAGEGPPLVLLHGVLGDSRVWNRQLADLSDRFTVIAWDAPGAGRSSDPPEPFGMADWAGCLAGLMDVIGIDRAHILGLSWGGILAQEFYRRHPARTRSLILADTYAGWRGSLPESVYRERLAAVMREVSMPASEFVPAWIPGLFSEAASEELREELASIMSDFHPVGYRVMIQTSDSDTRDLLPNIRVPTLLVWGEEDQRAPLTVARQLRDAIPEARLVIIPGAGHVSNLEQPVLFNAAVRDFCLSLTTA